MGNNRNSGVVALRLPHEVIAALMRMSEAREITMNAMVGKMIARRVAEVRAEEGW